MSLRAERSNPEGIDLSGLPRRPFSPPRNDVSKMTISQQSRYTRIL